MRPIANLVLLAPFSAIGGFLHNLLAEGPFAGVHQLVWFDWAILLPYFAILIVLCVYGIHRFELIHAYFKHRKNAAAHPPLRFDSLPRVTIQLPLFNELYVVERLVGEAVKIEYPRELLQIQVLDDSTDATAAFTASLVERYRALGFPIAYHHREHRRGFKAGALQDAMENATGELVALFDADFCPPPDFLMRTVHFFADPAVGAVQARWTYLNRDYNFLTRVEAMLLDGHFILEHGARSRAGRFFNFNGTAGILRKRMIDDAGGWRCDTLTEDTDLSYRAQLKGWRFVYLPGLECPSELPVEIHGFQTQQSRWAKGLTQVAGNLLPSILKADIPKRVKAEAFLHLTRNISYPLAAVASALILPVMIVRFDMSPWQAAFLDLPLIAASFGSLVVFYMVARREIDPQGWKRSALMLPLLISVGVGLTVVNTRAVLEALFGIKTGFVRTPKYAVGERAVKLGNREYGRRSGLLPYIEILAGAYFLLVVLFAVRNMNYPAAPFLLLLVLGYYWAGFGTLYQQRQGRLRRLDSDGPGAAEPSGWVQPLMSSLPSWRTAAIPGLAALSSFKARWFAERTPPAAGRRVPLVFPVLCCQSLLLFWNLNLLPVWGDEVFTLRTVAQPLGGIIWTTGTADIHPPLYFLLLHAWARLPLPWTGIAALRAFSAAMALLATFLFDHFWLSRLKTRRRLLALLLFAFSPCLLLYGRMARSYSMQTAVALLAISWLWRWLREPNRAIRRGAPALAAATMLVYTHYLSGLAVLAGFALAAWRRLGLARIAWFCVAAGAAYVLWLPALARALRNWVSAEKFQSHYALTGSLVKEQGLKIAFGLTSLTIGESFYPVSLALVPVMLALAWRGCRLRTFGPSLRPLLFLVAAIAYIGGSRWVTWPFMAARLLWLLPFLTLALALGILRCRLPVRRLAATAILASFAFSITLYFRRENYANLGYAAPLREIANRLRLETSPGDVTLVDQYNADADGLLYYLGNSFAAYPVSAQSVALARAAAPPAAVWFVRNTRDLSPGNSLTSLQLDICHGRRRADSFYEPYAPWQRAALRWVGAGAAAPEYFYQVTVCR